MRLSCFCENDDEAVEIDDTSATEKLDQLSISITWLWNVDKMIPLRPCDAICTSKPADELNVSDQTIQNSRTIDNQAADPFFVERTIITKLTNIYSS